MIACSFDITRELEASIKAEINAQSTQDTASTPTPTVSIQIVFLSFSFLLHGSQEGSLGPKAAATAAASNVKGCFSKTFVSGI